MSENLVYKNNGWNEWSKYVLMTIDTIIKDLKRLEEQTSNNKEELITKITELNSNLIQLTTEMRIKNRITNIIIGIISGVLSGAGVLLIGKILT